MARPGSARARLFLAAFGAFAFAADAVEPRPKDVIPDPAAEWTVAVAAFDTAEMDAPARLAGDLIAGRLSSSLFGVEKRKYPDAERGAYMRHLASNALDAAAKELATKRAARDALLFSGMERWKYESELMKADEAVRTAMDAYAEVSRGRPEVVPVKPLKAAKENASGAVPAAPKKGEERAYCLQHSYDAVLLGKIESFYGRTYVSLRLFSPYLNADLYTDETTFSTGDREQVLSELAFRLAAAASGVPPSRVSVGVEPNDADILLNGVFSGTGKIGPVEHAPGSVRLYAEKTGFERFDETIELFPGEQVKVDIQLPALKTSRLTVEALGVSGEKQESNIRVNGLYLGTSPHDIDVSGEQYSYVQADTSDNTSAAAVVRSGSDGTIALRLAENPPKDATPVEDVRKAFYGAFGRFTVLMPVAFLVSGIATTYQNSAINYNTAELKDQTGKFQLASTILWTVTGAFAVESIIRLIAYIRGSGARAAQSVPVDEK